MTIQDAKDGDVLVDEYNNIGIYKEIDGICWHSYIYLGCNGHLYGFSIDGFSIGGSHIQNNTKPATKEQRDTLFAKMRETGYEWDANKKELKKIGQKSVAWSKEDEEIYRKCICSMRASACGFPEEEKFVEQVDNWFNSLKDRIQPQPKQEWSEEDEEMIKRVIEALSAYADKLQYEGFCHIIQEYIDWLKSLKDRYIWKPSDEQMKALTHLFDGHLVGAKLIPKDYDNLRLLLEQLKKLRE